MAAAISPAASRLSLVFCQDSGAKHSHKETAMPVLIRTRTYLIVLIALATVTSAGLLSKDLPAAKPEDVGLSSERLARMNKMIHAYVDAGRTPGVVTLIARHGKVVHVDAYGKADLATGRPTRADDIFRMYSMTKPITSTALLILFEEGKFQLTDPLSKFFPAFADVGAERRNAGQAPAADHGAGHLPPHRRLQLRLRHLVGRQGLHRRQRIRD